MEWNWSAALIGSIGATLSLMIVLGMPLLADAMFRDAYYEATRKKLKWVYITPRQWLLSSMAFGVMVGIICGFVFPFIGT